MASDCASWHPAPLRWLQTAPGGTLVLSDGFRLRQLAPWS